MLADSIPITGLFFSRGKKKQVMGALLVFCTVPSGQLSATSVTGPPPFDFCFVYSLTRKPRLIGRADGVR